MYLCARKASQDVLSLGWFAFEVLVGARPVGVAIAKREEILSRVTARCENCFAGPNLEMTHLSTLSLLPCSLHTIATLDYISLQADGP